MANVQGTCSEKFIGVRETFERNLDTGLDIGASVAVFIDGEPVVDLWGGYFDGTFTRPFERDTIVQVFSSTKTVTALCALILADRGVIDLDAPVAKYWPEFDAEGKAEVAVRQLLGHTSGLCGWTERLTHQDLYDVEKSTALLARQAPLWKPGRVAGYHGYTQGHLVGEVIRRVTGKSLGSFLREDVAEPLGVGDDFHIGTPAEFDSRVSLLIQGKPISEANGNPYYDCSLYNPRVTPRDTWELSWRRAELGAMNGHGNARGIATLQSVLACGGANGVRLMSTSGRERVLEQQSNGLDLALEFPLNWGMGYSLVREFYGAPSSARVAWWAGNGGSVSFVDLDAHMAIGFVPNKWIGGSPHEQDRSRSLIQAAYRALNPAS